MRRIAGLFVLVFLLAACSGGHHRASPPPPHPEQPVDGTWHFIRAHGKTGCARGRRFGFWARLESLRRLMIYFEGGGGCFSYETCARGSGWFDPAVNLMDNPSRFPQGILNLADPRNPFRDWSIVFVPSCTGDVFIGSTDHTYRHGKKTVTVQHRGWFNAEAAVHWAFGAVPNPGRVFVTGSSAGSVGSAFHAPEIIDHYRGAGVAQLGDSLAFASQTPMLLIEWHGLDHLPGWMRSEPDVQPGRFRMVAFLTHLVDHYRGVTFARFNYRSDFVQRRFYGPPGTGPTFTMALLRDERRLARRAPGYRSYLACGSGHMVLPSRRLYGLTVGLEPLRDWVARLANGEPVGSPQARAC
jgi:Pectinacetylesterase